MNLVHCGLLVIHWHVLYWHSGKGKIYQQSQSRAGLNCFVVMCQLRSIVFLLCWILSFTFTRLNTSTPWRLALLHRGANHISGSEGRRQGVRKVAENNGGKSWLAPRERQEHSHLVQSEKEKRNCTSLSCPGVFSNVTFSLCFFFALLVLQPPLSYLSKGRLLQRCHPSFFVVLCPLLVSIFLAFGQNVL